MLTIERMYSDYLKRVKIKENDMHPVQKIEMRRAFYAGISSFLHFMVNEMPEDEELGSIELDKMHKECLEFWNNQK